MHPTSSYLLNSSLTQRRRPASASAKMVANHHLERKPEEPTDATQNAICRQVVYPPWGYNAGCEGSPVVIMNHGAPSSRPASSSGRADKRFGFDKKRMLLPSPAAFSFVSPKQPQSRPQTSMSCYTEQPQPWYEDPQFSTTF